MEDAGLLIDENLHLKKRYEKMPRIRYLISVLNLNDLI
jgi:hypothetical protein